MARRRYSADKIENILKLYAEGSTYSEIQKTCDVSEGGLIRVLKRFGVIGRGKTQRSKERSGRKWFWNFRFFDEPNEISAYWAGFLLADGSIVRTKDGWHLKLEIQVGDLSHLQQFCDDIGLDRKAIQFRTKSPKAGALVKSVSKMCSVCLVHRKLAESLEKWGVVPRKTEFPIQPGWPTICGNKIRMAFLRGWFDGDGNLYLNKKHQERFTITGNKFLLRYYAFCLDQSGYEGNIRFVNPPGKIWGKLRISGRKQVKQVTRLLTMGTGPKLERKWIRPGADGRKTAREKEFLAEIQKITGRL